MYYRARKVSGTQGTVERAYCFYHVTTQKVVPVRQGFPERMYMKIGSIFRRVWC